MTTFREKAKIRAGQFIGVKEHPPGSNRGVQIDKWQKRTNGIVGYPWCGAFIYCMFRDVGTPISSLPSGAALVENWVKWARWGSKAVAEVVTRPLRGDVVCFDWGVDGWRDHIGIVEKVLALRWRGGRFVGLIRSIEGNTSAGNDSNGGEVQRRWRWMNGSQVFIRIKG